MSALGGKADVAEFKAGIGGSNAHTIHSSMAVSQNQEGLRLLMTLSRPPLARLILSWPFSLPQEGILENFASRLGSGAPQAMHVGARSTVPGRGSTLTS
jgi:hypothetical protein